MLTAQRPLGLGCLTASLPLAQAAGAGRTRFERGGYGAFRAAAHLQAHEGGNAENQEEREEDEERGVNGENGRGQERRERHHGEEEQVARGARGKQAHEHDEEHQVNRGVQGGVEPQILHSGNVGAGDDEQVEGEEENVGGDEDGGEAVGKLGWLAAGVSPGF